MKIKVDSKQQYQLNAVSAVVDIFDGFFYDVAKEEKKYDIAA